MGVVGYNVYKGLLIGLTLVGSTSELTYTITGLSPNTTYGLKIAAKDAAGNLSSYYSIYVDTLAADTQAPTAPTGLTATSVGSTSLALSWAASTDNIGVTGYDVYNGNTLVGSTTGALTYNVTGLNPSTSYTFTVKAKDAAGNVSAVSNPVSVTTAAVADTQAPTTPSNVRVISKTSTSIT